MTKIAIGDALPPANFKYLAPEGLSDKSSDELFKNRCVLIVGVLGAFTPICSKQHIPDFIPYAKELVENWIIDEVVCISAADPFVLRAWAESMKIEGCMTMLTDTHAAFANEIGLGFDGTHLGLGHRSTRYVMLVKDNTVMMLNAEDRPQQMTCTSKQHVEASLKELEQDLRI